jgi:uncharacterized protein (TIGR00251 family)
VRESKGRVVLDVFVQPRAARDAIGGLYGTALKIKTKAPPADGKANAAVVDLVAEWLGIPRRNVELVSGSSSRHKRLALTGLPLQEVSDACGLVLHSGTHERP